MASTETISAAVLRSLKSSRHESRPYRHWLLADVLPDRICQDTDGFWLEPHTDIGAKRFTMLVHLSDAPDGENWGTDIYDAEKRLVATAPCATNRGLIFLPGADTWHGFRRRPITGVRRSLIINPGLCHYVNDDWRARHELAFPDKAVSG